MKISIQSFKGVAPRINPRYLPEGVAQTCRNAEAIGWSLKPYAHPTDTADTIPVTTKTLYRYNAQGQTPMWFHWDDDVDVVKSQIANDTEEWTHFTGDSEAVGPRSTYASIVGSGNSVSMGVQPPEQKLSLLVQGEEPDASAGEVPETRVYVATFIRQLAGVTAQSMPSPASNTVDVYSSTQSVDVDLPALNSASNVTGIRLYRSVSGEYLFVGEFDAAKAGTTINDAAKSDELNQPLPSLNWAPPPEDLTGLVNMPNGVVAGFVNRDVFFCEPYRPYAWPVAYMQSLDYDIVGLGVLDTTLVVLTTGEPYFIQGATPDSMVVVKAQNPQSCVSKRSIVSAQGSVFYASPDGLMRVSTSGSELVTWEKFSVEQWQALNPASFNAFFHEDKYIAFYDNGTESGAFVMDLRTGEVSFSEVYAEAGFRDLFDDALYIKQAGRSTVSIWRGSNAKQEAVWRSKRYSMPRRTSLSWAHVEAENYPLTCRVYSDGALIHTQNVASRDPFRLPSAPGRDWEVEVETDKEVFALMLAQSSKELASG